MLATKISELSEDELRAVTAGGDILASKKPGTNIDFYITLANDFGNAVNSHYQDSMNWQREQPIPEIHRNRLVYILFIFTPACPLLHGRKAISSDKSCEIF